jgi:HSP20 family molecular chaperone IbpA
LERGSETEYRGVTIEIQPAADYYTIRCIAENQVYILTGCGNAREPPVRIGVRRGVQLSQSRCAMATSKPAPSSIERLRAPRIIGESDKQEFDQVIQRRVAERAYILYEASGRQHGNHDRHWFQAKNEVLQRGLDIRESGSWLSINAYIPDVSADDLQVYLEPKRVIVRAEKKESTANSDSGEQRFTYHDIFMAEDLNSEVDPSTASAAFKDQKLTLMVKKSSAGSSAGSTSHSAARS